MTTIFKRSLIKQLTVFFVLLSMFASCSVVNPNYKIAGKYELSLENPNTKKRKKGNSISDFIGKTLIKNMITSDVEFHLDGTADIDVDFFGADLMGKNGVLDYAVKGNILTLTSDETDELSFKFTKTSDGFKLENEDGTFYLVRKVDE